MDKLHVKQEEPDDGSSAHVQVFETNDESANGARVNHPLALDEPSYRIEEVYVKVEPSDCSSSYSDDKSGARVRAGIEGVHLYTTEKCDIDVKKEPDVSGSTQFEQFDLKDASLCKTKNFDICIKDGPDDSGSSQFQQFDSDDVYVRVTAPSIEGVPLCKMDNFDIDIKEELNDSSITHFQECSRLVSSQKTAGKGLSHLPCFSRELIMDILVAYSEEHI